MTGNNILKGLKVVELASVLAGPSVGTFLAEMGAEVIKVENPDTGGDITRRWKLPAEDPDSTVSAYYCSANWNKESIFLDLKKDADRQNVRTLIADADILLENFKPGDSIKFSLDYKSVKLLNPRLIVGHIQAYSDQDAPGFDVVIQAECGFMSLNGPAPEGLKWPLPIVDILAAHQLKEGILLALIQRAQTGRGSLVSVSLFDAAVASLYNIGGNVLMGGADPVATGRLHANIAPYGETVTSSDGVTIVLAVGTDQQFHSLCEILNCTKDFTDSFSTNSMRVRDRGTMETTLRNHARRIGFDVLEKGLIGKKVPFGKVKTVKEVLASLPENSFLREKTEGVGTVRMRTAIFTIDT